MGEFTAQGRITVGGVGMLKDGPAAQGQRLAESQRFPDSVCFAAAGPQ